MFLFLGRTKLGLTYKETGRLTLRTFNELYRCYKQTFDLEMLLKASKTTYKSAEIQVREDDEWF